jgi:hypothetical protein
VVTPKSAGQSVHVLPRVYAKFIDRQDQAARCRIEGALNMDDDPGRTLGFRCRVFAVTGEIKRRAARQSKTDW